VTSRASTANLALSLLAFFVFMVLLLAVVGSGVGSVELLIWSAILAVGVALIVRRYRTARGAQ